jgi:hypothetical protein
LKKILNQFTSIQIFQKPNWVSTGFQSSKMWMTLFQLTTSPTAWASEPIPSTGLSWLGRRRPKKSQLLAKLAGQGQWVLK